MQISTRTEDFVVDTLKLRVHIGPCLRKIFEDPSKKKIMHGADRDILWLQRDFGIVCNLFDTGQASRVLKLERHSLEYLLRHYCGVALNKEYQTSDWRLRPIPNDMLRYAREDTHYLLYVYDLMRHDLLASTYAENSDALIEVYKRSYDVCMKLYEKELTTDTSYLHIYGLREADFNCVQLAVAAALYAWRDGIARAKDESTGFVLPNKALLEVARQLPLTPSKLHEMVGIRYPFVERQLDLVVNIIKCAIIDAPAFVGVLEQLKKEQLEAEVARIKLGHLRPSVRLRLLSIPGVTVERPKECLESPQYQPAESQHEREVQPNHRVGKEIIPLGGESHVSQQSAEMPESSNSSKDSMTQRLENMVKANNIEQVSDTKVKVGFPSLVESSSGLEKCSHTLSQSKVPSSEKIKPSPWRPQHPLRMEPYDHAAAKKHVNSRGNRAAENGLGRKSRSGIREQNGRGRGSFGETTRVGFQHRPTFLPSRSRKKNFMPSNNFMYVKQGREEKDAGLGMKICDLV